MNSAVVSGGRSINVGSWLERTRLKYPAATKRFARNPCDAAYDLGIVRITKVPDWHGRFGGRDKEQTAPLEFAPAAVVTIVAELDKIDRAVVFAGPNTLGDLILTGIDLHECAWTDQGIERVVLGPDVPVKHILETRLLLQEAGHLT